MTPAIEISGLSKLYGSVRAVEALDLRIERGEIYGFLGRNGAGKTTTIRAMLGMIGPTHGTVKLLGETVGPHGRGPWRRVGHLVERPTAYPELTTRENLEVARRLQGVADGATTSRAIERLGLAPYADRPAGTLSTGNLQRLALARALLHDPELLILDEPANGLDPAGVVEIRDLLAGLARERGVTVFMSSHILPEVDRLATRIGIIHQGHLVRELAAGEADDLRSQRLEVKAADLEAAQRVLARSGYAVSAAPGMLILKETAAIDAPERVATLLVNAGVPPTRLAVEEEELETYFLRLTEGAP